MLTIAEIFRSYAVLDENGRHVNGTDKMSNHNYGSAYETLFPNRSSVKLMMEVGVADGSCLLAWRDIFPSAVCVGLDTHPSDRAYGERIEFYLGNQLSKEDCERAVAGRKFDLIVEDATHHLQDTLVTLYHLWPHVAPGGLYVVEEWENLDKHRIQSLWPNVWIIDTVGPFGGTESLVVFRKPPL